MCINRLFHGALVQSCESQRAILRNAFVLFTTIVSHLKIASIVHSNGTETTVRYARCATKPYCALRILRAEITVLGLISTTTRTDCTGFCESQVEREVFSERCGVVSFWNTCRIIHSLVQPQWKVCSNANIM